MTSVSVRHPVRVGLNRRRVSLALAVIAGAVLWLTLVPNDDPGAQARNPAYWWLALSTAIVLGAFTRSNESAIVGAAVALPALVLAGWTAPRGDDDGLWLLWFPLLFGFLLALAFAGAVGGWLGARIDARNRS